MSLSSVKSLSIVTFFVFSTNFSHAGQTCAEMNGIRNREGLPYVTIEQVMGLAIASHPQVERAEIALENSYEDIQIARSRRFPQITASYEYSRINNPINTPTTGAIEPRSFGLNASLLLFDFFAIRHQVEAARERSNRAKYALVTQEYATALSAADSYLDVLQQRLALDFALSAYNDLRAIKTALTDSGLASQADVFRAIQTKEGVCSTTRTFFNEHQKATSFFESVVNIHPENIFFVEPKNIAVDMDKNNSYASAQLFHPAFASAEAQIRDAKQLAIAARRERLPKISLVASSHDYSHASNDFGNRQRDGGSVGIRFTVPVYMGGRYRSEIKKADGNIRMATLDRESLIRTSQRQIRDLIQALMTAEDRLQQQKNVVNASLHLFNGYLQQFNTDLSSGKVDSQNLINLVDERVKLYQAQADLNALTYSLIMDRYNLLAQQGLLLGYVER